MIRETIFKDILWSVLSIIFSFLGPHPREQGPSQYTVQNNSPCTCSKHFHIIHPTSWNATAIAGKFKIILYPKNSLSSAIMIIFATSTNCVEHVCMYVWIILVSSYSVYKTFKLSTWIYQRKEQYYIAIMRSIPRIKCKAVVKIQNAY